MIPYRQFILNIDLSFIFILLLTNFNINFVLYLTGFIIHNILTLYFNHDMCIRIPF